MHLSKITIENFRCFGDGDKRFEMDLKPGLTALVGENDSGKSAVIDAIRIALGTTDNDWFRVEETDFFQEETSRDIKIICKFEELNNIDKRAFVEYLSYEDKQECTPVLFVNWTAKGISAMSKGRSYARVEVRSGIDGSGPNIAPEARDLLRTTYLKPLRDAEQSLSAGRASRLAQILQNTENIKNNGREIDPKKIIENIDVESIKKLDILEIGDLANFLLKGQDGVVGTREEIDNFLKHLTLNGDTIKSNISISGESASPEIRLRRLLEKFNLNLDGIGKYGLGTNNLLFMACEFLLLAQEAEGNKLLLIEEPEAHLHTQRQLQVIKFLQEQAEEKGIQVIVTTHSPNLASVINIQNLVIIQKYSAFALDIGNTELNESDYRFLQRFLDVTKANLFFARGVLIVEGDAENILLPTIARLIDRDFAKHGVSIVNVGNLGLRRYAKIFQRKNVNEENANELLDIPVACVTDMDVMPDCAPEIIGILKKGDNRPPRKGRSWRVKCDFVDLKEHREKKNKKASGQNVRTFISDEWTLEYDLAIGPKDENNEFHGGLALDIFVAACLANNDDAINDGKKKLTDVIEKAVEKFYDLEKAVALEQNGNCSVQEVLSARIYAEYLKSRVSKPVAAQYLAELLQEKQKKNELTPKALRRKLPNYLTAAIDYVTRYNYDLNFRAVGEETIDE